MRKVGLTLAAGLAAVVMGTPVTRADGLSGGYATSDRAAMEAIYRPSVDGVPMVESVRLICTHFWNGRWHRREICFRTPDYGRHHGRHHRHFRRHWH